MICNGDGEEKLLLEQTGSMGLFESCTRPQTKYHEFRLLNLDGHKIGNIKKLFGIGNLTARTDKDVFEINFPVNLDVKDKAICMAAVMLIDRLYF